MCGSPMVTSVRGGTGLIERDDHFGDVGGQFETALGAFERDRNALRISQMHAADAANQRDARADHAIGAGKIAEFVDVAGASDQFADRSAGRETDAQTLYGEGIAAVAESQDSPAPAGANDKAGFGHRDANGPDGRLRRLRNAGRHGNRSEPDP